MALKIKDPTTEKLAREVAAHEGESLTEAVHRALEERLERLKSRRTAPDLVATLLEISQRCSSLPDVDPRRADEILGYDDTGAFRWP
jgi:antitoxin VapB